MATTSNAMVASPATITHTNLNINKLFLKNLIPEVNVYQGLFYFSISRHVLSSGRRQNKGLVLEPPPDHSA